MVKPRKRRSRITITTAEAMRRLAVMLERVETDVRYGLRIEATLTSANDRVLSLESTKSQGAGAFNAAAQSLTLDFAITVSRLFDLGGRRYAVNRRGIASIPLLIRLLQQKRCQKALIKSAHESWTPAGSSDALKRHQADACLRAITEALNIYRDNVSAAKVRHYRTKLRSLRDFQMAHSQLDDSRFKNPTYNELYHLMDAARDIVERTRLAVDGRHLVLSELENYYKSQGEAFWSRALVND